MAERIPMAHNPLFAGISDDEKERLNGLAHQLRVAAGTRVVEQGEIGRRFILIVDGAVDIVQDGETVAQLGPGDFFGEMALLGLGEGGFHRSATVVATSDTTMEVMSSVDFDAAVGSFPESAAVIRSVALDRQADNN